MIHGFDSSRSAKRGPFRQLVLLVREQGKYFATKEALEAFGGFGRIYSSD